MRSRKKRKKEKREEEIYFFFNDTATTEIYTLSLHDALPIYKIGKMALTTLENSMREHIHHLPRASWNENHHGTHPASNDELTSQVFAYSERRCMAPSRFPQIAPGIKVCLRWTPIVGQRSGVNSGMGQRSARPPKGLVADRR